MNKHTRKKYPQARREVTVWVDPEPTVSLFNETVAKLAKAEAALTEANKRIADLEKALDNSRKLNMMHIRRSFPGMAAAHPRDLNSLTAEEEEQLFAMRENEPWIDPEATPEPERQSIGKRIREVASVLLRRPQA